MDTIKKLFDNKNKKKYAKGIVRNRIYKNPYG